MDSLSTIDLGTLKGGFSRTECSVCPATKIQCILYFLKTNTLKVQWSNGYDFRLTWLVRTEGSRFDPGLNHIFALSSTIDRSLSFSWQRRRCGICLDLLTAFRFKFDSHRSTFICPTFERFRLGRRLSTYVRQDVIDSCCSA